MRQTTGKSDGLMATGSDPLRACIIRTAFRATKLVCRSAIDLNPPAEACISILLPQGTNSLIGQDTYDGIYVFGLSRLC